MADAELPFAACLESLAQRVPQHLRQPQVGIICGSGLSTLAAALTDAVYVPYGELPGFGISTGALSSAICPHKAYVRLQFKGTRAVWPLVSAAVCPSWRCWGG